MDQQVYAMKISDIFNVDVRKKIFGSVNKKIKSIFPSPDSLYSKDIVKKHELIQSNVNNFNLNNNIPANPVINISLGLTSGSCNKNPTTSDINDADSNNNFNFPNSKKKYFEEDNNNVNNAGSCNGKNGHLGKNKKALGKIQYREKIISSSISNDNNTNNFKNENFDNFIEIDKSKFNGVDGKNALNNQNIPEADINSNETTSTSSKDDNFTTNNKQGEMLMGKKDEKSFGELIEIIKFDSGKLSGLNRLTNPDNISCQEVNNSIFNSSNLQAFTSNGSNSNLNNNKNLFTCRESSRFTFVDKNNTSQSNSNNNRNNKHGKSTENVEIPGFVLELIQKKISRQWLTKKFEFMEDILFCDELLQKEYINENHWAEFILEHKNIDTDKELIFDFEMINKSLKHKFKTNYLK